MDELGTLRHQIAALERRIAALERAGPPPVTHEIQSIADAVCQAFRVDSATIYSPGKRGPQVLARQVAMKIAFDRNLGAVKIGRAFNMDHTTVLYAARKVIHRLGIDADFAATYEAIMERFGDE